MTIKIWLYRIKREKIILLKIRKGKNIMGRTNKISIKNVGENFIYNNGITLISLIVTIIILLLLVGITINIFMNSGISENAKMAKFATNFREVEEKTNLYIMDKEINEVIKKDISIQNNLEIFPITTKLNDIEKEVITNKITTLKTKMEELTGKKIEELNLYWIDKQQIGVNKKHKYIIDIDTRQIYDYEGEKIYKKMWHTLDSQVEEERIPGEIYINITPNTLSIVKKINIDYGDYGKEKYYKIGANNTKWESYVGEITLTAEEIIKNNLRNEDGTVTIYAKGKKEDNQENIKEKIIYNIDLGTLDQPIINIDAKPILYSSGVKVNTKIDIVYDKTEGVQNYYSLDGGINWNLYNGIIQTDNDINEVKAKSIKNSGLEVRLNKRSSS